MNLHELLSSPVMHRLGWTLLHSLWLGAAVLLRLEQKPVRDLPLRRVEGHDRFRVLEIGLGVEQVPFNDG